MSNPKTCKKIYGYKVCHPKNICFSKIKKLPAFCFRFLYISKFVVYFTIFFLRNTPIIKWQKFFSLFFITYLSVSLCVCVARLLFEIRQKMNHIWYKLWVAYSSANRILRLIDSTKENKSWQKKPHIYFYRKIFYIAGIFDFSISYVIITRAAGLKKSGVTTISRDRYIYQIIQFVINNFLNFITLPKFCQRIQILVQIQILPKNSNFG